MPFERPPLVDRSRSAARSRVAGAGPSRSSAAPDSLPPRLAASIHDLSGIPLDDVRVRYNSPLPKRIDADAFARGREIHLAAGREADLPHEAWHLVQQAQGRVRPTGRLGAVPVNEDAALEREADRMGARAAAGGSGPAVQTPAAAPPVAAPHPLQARGSRSRRRKRWQAMREGQKSPRGAKKEEELNLAALGDKQVTVYRVEHDAKPSILSTEDQRLSKRGRNAVVQAPEDSPIVKPQMRQPTQNLKLDIPVADDSTHWFSFDTPDRAIANRRQRVGNQLAAHKGPGPLPAKNMPKLKSFKISNAFAKQIQRDSVLERQSGQFPGRPINSDQNFAPNQFGLKAAMVRKMAKHAVKNSYMEYDSSDLATLQSIHGGGRSADDHLRRDPYPTGELRKKVGPARSPGKRYKPVKAKPSTYDRSKDPFERRESDRDIDPEAWRYLWRNRPRTLADFMPKEEDEGED